MTFWYQHTDEREAALLDLIADFNQINPHSIEIQGRQMGTYNDIYNEMQKAIHSGADMPQLVVAYRYQALDYYRAGAAVDLAPYMDSPKWGLSTADRADYVAAFLNQDNIDGVQVAFLPNALWKFSITMPIGWRNWVTRGRRAPGRNLPKCAARLKPSPLANPATRIAAWDFL